MADLVSTKRRKDENSNALHRRFTKLIRTSGIVHYAKQNRTYERDLSRNVQRKERLTQLEKQSKFDKAYRLGRVSSVSRRKR